jgi:hypothetical protein
MTKEDEKSLVKKEDTQLKVKDEDSLQIGPQQSIDLSGLTEIEKREIRKKHAEGMVDVGKKAADMSVETQALGAKLSTMADETQNISESGGSVTISNVSEGSIGRTEIMMGTSEAAKKGRLSKTISGEKDYTLVYVGLAIVVMVIIAFMVMGR